jgi:hypothetical protein
MEKKKNVSRLDTTRPWVSKGLRQQYDENSRQFMTNPDVWDIYTNEHCIFMVSKNDPNHRTVITLPYLI